MDIPGGYDQPQEKRFCTMDNCMAILEPLVIVTDPFSECCTIHKLWDLYSGQPDLICLNADCVNCVNVPHCL